MTDDIEDLVDGDVRVFHSAVFPKPRSGDGARLAAANNAGDAASFLPEAKRVYVRTFGCAHNTSDSEYMAGLLASEGYIVSADAADAASADAWVINSCTVKDPSQAALGRALREGVEQGKAVVLAGCVPQAQKDAQRVDEPGVATIGVKQLERVGEAVAAALRGERFSALSSRGALPSLDLPKVRRDELVEIVPLSTGCLGACTYCKTRYARGKLGSYAPDAIEARVLAACVDGVAEVWLSSEDTGAYGIDLGSSLSLLLERIEPVLERFPFVTLRVGMTNPPYVLDQIERLALTLAHDNVYAFLHVPVQSGSDAILARDRMNREYTVGDFEQVVDGLTRRVAGGVCVATDVICGFPGETTEHFTETMALIGKYKFGTTNISQFYARPATPAAAMRPRVPTSEVKERSRQLSKLVGSFRPYANLLGATIECRARDELADGGVRLVAHTKQYAKVILPFQRQLVGARFQVRVTATHRWHVDAEFVKVVQAADASSRPALRAALKRIDKARATIQPDDEGDDLRSEEQSRRQRRQAEATHEPTTTTTAKTNLFAATAITAILLGVLLATTTTTWLQR